MQAYGFSKALLNAYTRLLAAQSPSLCVAACTPGFVGTGDTDEGLYEPVHARSRPLPHPKRLRSSPPPSAYSSSKPRSLAHSCVVLPIADMTASYEKAETLKTPEQGAETLAFLILAQRQLITSE